MERQYTIFIAAGGAAFAALIVLAFYNTLQQSAGDNDKDNADTIKVKKGQQVHIRYSSAVVKMIQDLPNKNSVEIEVSSELEVTNLAGLKGEVRYSDMEITYVDKGEEKTINDNDFKTIEYRFLPDIGNKTRYVYENVDYIADAQDSQVIVTIRPLSTAKVGEHFTVKMILHTGGVVNYQINEKTLEIVA